MKAFSFKAIIVRNRQAQAKPLFMSLCEEQNADSDKSSWMIAREQTTNLFAIVVLGLALTSVTLGALIWSLQIHGIGLRSSITGKDVFFYLLTSYEPLALTLLSGCFLAMYLLLRWQGLLAGLFPRHSRACVFKLSHVMGWSAAVGCLVILGRHFGYLDYDVCIDESLPHFQSEIFLKGALSASIPDKWLPFINAAKLSFVTIDWKHGVWGPGFLPIHSLLRTPAALWGLDGYMNAILLGGNLAIFYILLQRIWPKHPSRALIGFLLLAIYPQVIITCMTSFSMETHVLFTTAWLLFYLSKNEKVFLLTPWFGILCMGIHQPHIHLILAAPFILRLATSGRIGTFLYFAAVYSIGCVTWMSFLHLIRPSLAASGPLFQFSINPILQLIVQPSNLALLLSWSPPLLSVLFLAVCLSRLKKEPLIMDSLIAIGLLFAFYIAWPFSQGHGWGYRFMYPAIPFVIIVAIQGMGMLRLALGRQNMMRVVFISTAFTLLVQLPQRLWETRQFVGTHKAVYETITAANTAIVLLDTEQIWYGSDFIRNNPNMDNRPVILSLEQLTPRQIVLLKQDKYSIKIITMQDLRASGHPAAYILEQD